MDQYFRSSLTGKLMRYPHDIETIFGEGSVQKLLDEGVIVEVLSPSIEDCLKNGSLFIAVVRYHEIHKCSLREAREAIDQLKNVYVKEE